MTDLMMEHLVQLKNEWKCFGGRQRVFSHVSETTHCEMEFAVYEPPVRKEPPLVLYFLSGLTCTWQNFVTKAGAQRAAAEHNVLLVCPDTSPRGAGVPDCPGEDDMGQGAGFYLNATEQPWAQHFRMEDYVLSELPRLVETGRPLATGRALCGHSMGGHGALTLGIKNPDFFSSVSAFSPIVTPSEVPWGSRAFAAYLGQNEERWHQYDTCRLLRTRGYTREILVDQGMSDPFLDQHLKPQRLSEACAESGTPLTLRQQEGYDHSYYFIATFVADHLAWHRQRCALE
jgi:S-formylglutathione hydrolase